MQHESTPTTPRALRTLGWASRTLWWLALGIWGLLALSWGALHGWIVPRIGEWRPQLEQLATRSLGTPVRLGEIRALSTGLIPALELVDVRLLDEQGREALHLPQVQVSLSVRSLWRGGFEQLVIDNASLDVRLTRDGRWQVAGMDLSHAGADQTSALGEWFFDQAEFAIRNGQLRWHHEALQDEPLVLRDVDLVVRNPGRRHLMRLDATPPPDWGERLSLRADLVQPLLQAGGAHWRHWSGTLYAEFGRVDLARLRTQLRWDEAAAVQVHQGQGALRLWADLQRGELSRLTADTALESVGLQLGAQLPRLDVPALSGRVQMGWSAQGWELDTQDLMLLTPQGTPWSLGRFKLTHGAARRGEPQDTRLYAERIDLDALREVAAHLPLPAPWQAQLSVAQPRGLLSDLALRWSGPARLALEMPDQWHAQGRLDGLSIAPGRLARDAEAAALARPGLEGASIRFDASPQRGELQVGVREGALTWPGLFERARVEVDQLDGVVRWARDGERLDLHLDGLRFANADLAGQLQLHWHTGAGNRQQPRWPGVLDLDARLDRADGAQVHRYLPAVIGEPARRYVREAVVRGQASEARFRVRGDLQRFPFATRQDGLFQVRAQLSGVDFQYVPASFARVDAPAWPALRDLRGGLEIDGHRLALTQVQGAVADAGGLRIGPASAQLDDYTRLGTVAVDLRLGGPLEQMLGFVRRSPVAALTGQALAQARGGGNAELGLRLSLPLQQLASSRVTGLVTLPGNDLHLHPDSPVLARTQGAVQFSESGFEVAQASARVYGGELRFGGGMRAASNGQPASIRFQGQGQASVEGLRAAPELAFLAPLWRAASGSTAYQVQLAFDEHGRPDLRVQSTLQGLATQLPAPLDKAAASQWPLRLELGPLGPSAAPGDHITLGLGPPQQPLLNLRYERAPGPGGAQVLRGAWAVGGTEAALTLPERGVNARLQLAELDADAWQRWWQAWAPATTTAPGSPTGPSAHAAYLPTRLDLSVDRLRAAGRELRRLRSSARLDGRTWSVWVDAAEVAGQIEYRPPDARETDAGQIVARLGRLRLESGTATDVDRLLRQQPRSVPALDVVVDRFELGTRELGRLELAAVNRRADGGDNEWRLNRLVLEVPEARLSGQGNWTAVGASHAASAPSGPTAASADPARRTALNFNLAVKDAGLLLARFGMADVVRGGQGELTGQLGWLGSPLTLDHPSLSGQLKLDIERGQFLKADPGLAKLLGVLSLQALPRRLLLDFKDVFSEGFAFDFLRGDALVERGVARTNNLQMKGINAAVLLEGQADIARETQDIHVVVVPELNAGTASLIASAINPAVGLGSFLAQFLLRQPLQEAATQQFHISGRWDNPQVERVARKTTTPAPQTAPAAPQ